MDPSQPKVIYEYSDFEYMLNMTEIETSDMVPSTNIKMYFNYDWSGMPIGSRDATLQVYASEKVEIIEINGKGEHNNYFLKEA